MGIRAPIMDPPEVRCSRCGVSFPPEVRRCLHCGGRTHAPGQEEAVRLLAGNGLPVDAGGRPPAVLVPADEDEAMEGGPPSSLRLVSALIWILIAIAGGLYRVCSG